MGWNFTLHIDDINSDTSSWPDANSASQPAIWAIGPLPSDDSGTWLVGLRFVNRDGNPALVGIQIHPDHGVASFLRGLRPSATEIYPDVEVTATALRAVTLGSMQSQVRSALANYRDPAWGDNHLDAYDDGEPPWNWSEHDELTTATGVDTSDTAQRTKAGRRPHPDEFLAEIAYHYDRALRDDLPTGSSIQAEMSQGGERVPVEQWVSKARHRGFLTATTGRGQRGGEITVKARDTLKRSGFLDSEGERVTEREGTAE